MTLVKGPQAPPLYDLFMALKNGTMRDLRVCLPGNVQSVDAATGMVDVEISVLQQDQTGTPYTYPTITCHPITLQGGGIGMKFPISNFDECLVFFSDRCIDSWYKTGSPQPLPNLRMHDLSDGFAIVGINSLANVLDLALLTGEGGFADTQARVAIDPVTHKVAISNNAEQLATLMTQFITSLTLISTVPGGGPLNAASITALTAYIARFNNLLYP